MRIGGSLTWPVWERFLAAWGRNQGVRDEDDPPVECVVLREDVPDGVLPVDVRQRTVHWADHPRSTCGSSCT